MTRHSALRESTIPLQANWSGDESSRALIGRAQNGDVDAFELIYNEHSGRVYALCLRLMGGEQTAAAELMQDVFVRAWKNLGKFRGESAFSSWLHRLAVNAMLENARSDKRRVARVLPMEDTSQIGAFAPGDSPELRIDLERAIARLPAGARTAFVLHDIEGYQHQEIAEQLGVAVGTVKAQLHRAHKLLIQALDR
ncbi:MAG TPA: sigma-70 family RNA polymerase sigma factor [Gemmatimonadaceae bacterium]|nr:sigma-70 family RNA polymerase sigma factor [Gemmatimonadaceae bacterium]